MMACAIAIPKITFCPPGAARNARFDEYVGTRPHHPVEAHVVAGGEFASNGISFSDYRSMGTFQRKLENARRKPAPAWALNDANLRAVIVSYVEARAHFGGVQQPGTDAERLER